MNPEILITIERTGCEGICPVYSAEIYSDGTVIYRGEHFVKFAGEKRYKISEDKLEKIISEFNRINYFSLKNKYETDEFGICITCQPTTITSINTGGRRKKIINYYGAPGSLDRLANKIDKLSGLSELIGKQSY